MKIGFIGLGNLGMPIAKNLLAAHKEIFVYNRSFYKTKTLIDDGAIACQTVKELAQQCDIVFSIVSDDNAMKEITLGEDGIAMNLKDGGIHASISTILPATANELAKKHQLFHTEYVAIPVMGRPDAARSRQLNFLISGADKAVETIKPLLPDLGAATIWEFGQEAGAANVAKLCNNFLIASTLESIAEGVTLAKKSGISTAQWMKMVTGTFLNSPLHNIYGNIILNEAFTPAGFSLRLGLKDTNLVLEQAATANLPMELAQLIEKRMNRSVANGLAEHDWCSITLDVQSGNPL